MSLDLRPSGIGSSILDRRTRDEAALAPSHHSPLTPTLPVAFFLACAGIGVGLPMPNPEVSAAALAVLPFLCALVWRPGETPVLLFAVGFQWLQVTGDLWRAAIYGLPLRSVSQFPLVEEAVWIGLGALVVLGIGIRLGLRGMPLQTPATIAKEAESLSLPRVVALYIPLAALAWTLPAFMWYLLPVAQILLALAYLRWVFFFLLGYLTIQRRRGRWVFAVALLLEIAAGIGFFSGFKTPIFVALLVLLTARPRVTWRNAAVVVAAAAAVLYLMLAWMSIRDEYRSYLNAGSRQQVITVSRINRLRTFAALMATVSPDELAKSIDPLLSRLGYVDYLARVLEYVPAHRDHARGALWSQSLLHVMTPRLLFPEKATLPSSSELTMEYTGLQLPSGREGTSISMGYVAESYIDFGFAGMWLPLLFIGLGWGLAYRYLTQRPSIRIVGYAFATALLVNAYYFEISGIMLLGGVLMKFIVFALVIWFALPDLLRWLRQP